VKHGHHPTELLPHVPGLRGRQLRPPAEVISGEVEGEGQDVQQEAHQVDGQTQQHTLRLLRECDGPQEGDQEYAVVNNQGLQRWQVHYTAQWAIPGNKATFF